MPPSNVFAWAAFGLFLLVGVTEAALARERTSLERSFLVDFRMLYECLERLACDRDLSVTRTGGGWGRTDRQVADRLKERFALVVDREKLHFVKEPLIYIGEIGNRSDKRNRSELRTMQLDPDTGELSVPDRIEIGKFKVIDISFGFTLINADGKWVCEVNLLREYSENGIKVTVTSEGKDGPEVCRDFMASLESKLKLASRLKEAKNSRRPGAKPKEPIPPKPK